MQIVASVFVFSKSAIAVGPFTLQKVMIMLLQYQYIKQIFVVPSCVVALVTMKDLQGIRLTTRLFGVLSINIG